MTNVHYTKNYLHLARKRTPQKTNAIIYPVGELNKRRREKKLLQEYQNLTAEWISSMVQSIQKANRDISIWKKPRYLSDYQQPKKNKPKKTGGELILKYKNRFRCQNRPSQLDLPYSIKKQPIIENNVIPIEDYSTKRLAISFLRSREKHPGKLTSIDDYLLRDGIPEPMIRTELTELLRYPKTQIEHYYEEDEQLDLFVDENYLPFDINPDTLSCEEKLAYEDFIKNNVS